VGAALGVAPRCIGKTGGVRSRAILLVLVGALAAGAGAARVGLGRDDVGSGRTAATTAAIARGELPEPLALAAVARTRDAADRDAERRIDAFAAMFAFAILVAAAWWTSARLQTLHLGTRVQVGARPRAPPTPSVLVVSS
jgi:hypothetical protein